MLQNQSKHYIKPDEHTDKEEIKIPPPPPPPPVYFEVSRWFHIHLGKLGFVRDD